jgi:hypothetical protein
MAAKVLCFLAGMAVGAICLNEAVKNGSISHEGGKTTITFNDAQTDKSKK